MMARYIDADNLISVLDILCDKGGDIRYWEQLKWIVADCPTEDVAPVIHAKWKGDGEVLICSNCKGISDAYFDCYDERFEFNGVTGWARRDPKYCKRCGAEMYQATISDAELTDDLFEKENNDNTV